ncbi:MAG: cytochrome c oxidase assembly protein [Hydrocarboniphaga sp.]|uniref:cytochrome c oxidase assembly protein n=1 Tax=Hydrocarboniphaga sp. TaxID=2033016 RepID=UPI00260B9BC7|nr:cytochrome c oxidase assembly protein [Hydrocarboniphaga sp.]MDB5973231.1 cytochrome c oxidase assembly protein [Hydrocarboniphaga sp.]
MSDAADSGTSRGLSSAKRNALVLVVVVVGMFGFGYATVPLYNALCVFTGLNGKVSNQAVKETAAAAVDTSREVKVQFVTTVNGGRDWEFRPLQSSVEVHPGEFVTVMFHARNTQDSDLVAQAVPNVAPIEAAKYLHKSECFCFNNQPFKAGEEKMMPVRFVLDREIPPEVDTVTLSYTFFDVTEAAAKAAAKTAPKS